MLRHRGYTTWMLSSALNNPKVFIVCRDERCKHDVKNQFQRILYESNRLSMMTKGKDIMGKYVDWPKFIIMGNVYESIRGYDQFTPVIFDNSCFD